MAVAGEVDKILRSQRAIEPTPALAARSRHKCGSGHRGRGGGKERGKGELSLGEWNMGGVEPMNVALTGPSYTRAA